MVPLVAQDRRATAIAFGYIREYLERSPMLSGMVANILASEIELTNGITVACFPSCCSMTSRSTTAGTHETCSCGRRRVRS